MAALSACVSAPQQPYAAVQQRPQPSTATFPIKPVANPPKPFEALKVDQRETPPPGLVSVVRNRSEEHTSELQSLMRISYAVFCLKKKNINKKQQAIHYKTTMSEFTTELVSKY